MSKNRHKNNGQNHAEPTVHSHEPVLAKILRWSVYASAFIPLVIWKNYISPFHFGKVIIFRTLIEVALVLYIVLVIKDRSYLPRPNRIFWTFLGFALAFSLTTITSVLPYASFWGSLERMGGLWSFWHYFAFFIIATTTLRTREHWYRLLDLSIFAGILSCLYGFGQRTDIELFVGSGGRERIFGTIGNPALFAGYVIINFFLALVMYLHSGIATPKKWLYGTAIGFSFLAIMMSAVRGSVIGTGVGIFIFAFGYFLKYKSKLAKLIVMSIVLGGLFLFLAAFTPLGQTSPISGNRYLSRLTNVNFDSYTAKTRFWAWEAGLNGWKETPKTILFGWGPENFNIPFSKHFNPLFFNGPGSETLFDRAHNMFVEILVTMGLVGLLTYLIMFWGAFSSLSIVARQRPSEYLWKLGLSALIVAYMIHNAFIFDTSANFIAFFIVLSFVSYLLNSLKPAPASGKRGSGGLAAVAGIILMIVALVIITKTNIRSRNANFATTRGIIAGWDGNFNEAVKKYKESLSYDVAGKYDYRHRLAQYVLEYANNRKLDPELSDAINYTIEEVKKNEAENPPDYLPLLYLSRLYIMLGKEDGDSPHNDTALAYSLKALDLSPTFVRTYYEVAQAYLNKKDIKKALEYFKRAAELNPEVGISYWYWGVTLIESGNIKEGLEIAQQAIEKGYSLGETEYARLINVYSKLNDVPKIAQAYEALVAIKPDNAQYRASLAVAYARIGEIDKAVEQARKAAELDPTFTDEAKRFVETLGRIW